MRLLGCGPCETCLAGELQKMGEWGDGARIRARTAPALLAATTSHFVGVAREAVQLALAAAAGLKAALQPGVPRVALNISCSSINDISVYADLHGFAESYRPRRLVRAQAGAALLRSLSPLCRSSLPVPEGEMTLLVHAKDVALRPRALFRCGPLRTSTPWPSNGPQRRGSRAG